MYEDGRRTDACEERVSGSRQNSHLQVGPRLLSHGVFPGAPPYLGRCDSILIVIAAERVSLRH